MTLPLTHLSLTNLDIRISEDYAKDLHAYKSASRLINALHEAVKDAESFKSFAWTDYCHHTKQKGNTVIGYDRANTELFTIKFKEARK